MISLRGPKLKYFAGIMALIALVVGVYFTFFQSRGFSKTTATITDYVEDDSGRDISYRPVVEYSVDGRSYTGELDRSFEKPDDVGKSVAILYDPNDPGVFHSRDGFGIYLMIVGAALLGIVMYSIIRGKKDLEQTEERQKENGYTGYMPHAEGEERELYFLTDLGTPKYGHRIEDKNRKVLYEAKMTKFSLAADFQFDFIDHEHGTTTPHLVGHTEESRWGTILIDVHCTFEFDGADVWKHLKENGISVDTNFTAGEPTVIGMQYRIFRDDLEIARAEQTSQYLHEEDEAQHKIAGALPIPGFFRIRTREKNLDLLFLTLMAFARSGAGDDRGGTYGAIVGTIANAEADRSQN